MILLHKNRSSLSGKWNKAYKNSFLYRTWEPTPESQSGVYSWAGTADRNLPCLSLPAFLIAPALLICALTCWTGLCASAGSRTAAPLPNCSSRIRQGPPGPSYRPSAHHVPEELCRVPQPLEQRSSGSGSRGFAALQESGGDVSERRPCHQQGEGAEAKGSGCGGTALSWPPATPMAQAGAAPRTKGAVWL